MKTGRRNKQLHEAATTCHMFDYLIGCMSLSRYMSINMYIYPTKIGCLSRVNSCRTCSMEGHEF